MKGTYNSGKPYLPAKGRAARRMPVEDYRSSVHPIIKGRPSCDEFLQAVERELKIRFYARTTRKKYICSLKNFLKWTGVKPNRITIELVRSYLEFLVDAGVGSDVLAGNISAIRTAFDKFCGRSVTLGLATPRQRKRLPIVPSRNEIVRLLSAAVSIRDKLLIGLMYAAGLRISEVVKLKWGDLDFDRLRIRVRSGKGRVDRMVMLPQSYTDILGNLASTSDSEFLFPSETPDRYISTRTVGRVVERAASNAGINKAITPHCLRHAFATHLLESGVDIRFVQRLLGHVRLETTTIYTRMAKMDNASAKCPLDELDCPAELEKSVGRLRCVMTMHDPESAIADVEVYCGKQRIVMKGIQVTVNQLNWLKINLPATELWQQSLSQWPPWLANKVQSAEFYQKLRQLLAQKFQQMSDRRIRVA